MSRDKIHYVVFRVIDEGHNDRLEFKISEIEKQLSSVDGRRTLKLPKPEKR